MDDAHDGPYAREPQIEDLVRICRALNNARARYLLIGGFAVIAHGGARTTKDIDLLVDATPENIARVKQALQVLEDHAVDEVADTDVARYTVVRVADEIVVDLMARACGIEYADAARDAQHLTIADVSIPVASLATLIRTKNTARPSDAADCRYLEELLRAERRDSTQLVGFTPGSGGTKFLDELFADRLLFWECTEGGGKGWRECANPDSLEPLVVDNRQYLPHLWSRPLEVWQAVPAILRRGRFRDDRDYELLVMELEAERLLDGDRQRAERWVAAYRQDHGLSS